MVLDMANGQPHTCSFITIVCSMVVSLHCNTAIKWPLELIVKFTSVNNYDSDKYVYDNLSHLDIWIRTSCSHQDESEMVHYKGCNQLSCGYSLRSKTVVLAEFCGSQAKNILSGLCHS